MKTLLSPVPLALLALPLSAQAWDLRLEVPFPKARTCPRPAWRARPPRAPWTPATGVIFTVSHRIVRVGPVLKFEWNAEYSQLQADGQIQQGPASAGSQAAARPGSGPA